MRIMRNFPRRNVTWCLVAAFLLAGCNVGPKYNRPSADAPVAYKELTPADYPNTDGWKVAQPKDDTLRGKWWEMFGDPQLNALEDKVSVSNQTIASAAASFLASRALVKEARAQLFPTLSANPSITQQRAPTALSVGASANPGSTPSSSRTVTEYTLPFDATWQPDLFGRVRNTISAAAYGAQASAADLENTRLVIQAEVATDYFQLRGQDALKKLLDSTVTAYQESLDLNKALYDTGIGNEEVVRQAETLLESTQAQDVALGIQRAEFEHAIAMLTGQPASTFSIAVEPLHANPPAIPLGVPSQLLERRPDIASAERLVAQANAQIGIARAAYFPTVTLSAAGGLESSAFASWFTWPSRFYSIGAAGAETIFDAGLRRATVQQFRAQYDETVANYREAVLTAFQQVEDNLSTLRILSQEIRLEDSAVESAQQTLDIALDRYRLGLDPYLNVITAQTALLSNQETSVTLRIQQMTASNGLIQALGGGWDASQLPTREQLVSKAP
jgi:NodT family efflux transporter outer membrane factor (OMF) lipoprotein